MIWRLIWITRAADTKDIRTLVKRLRALGQERQQALDRNEPRGKERADINCEIIAY